MTEDYSEDILFRVVAQICQMVGFQNVSTSPLYVLTDLLRELILNLGKRSRSYSELCGRTSVELNDLSLAFFDLHIYPSELLEFFTTVGSLPLPISVPRYPVAFNRDNQQTDEECNRMLGFNNETEEFTGCLATNQLYPQENNKIDPPSDSIELNNSFGSNRHYFNGDKTLDLFNNPLELRESFDNNRRSLQENSEIDLTNSPPEVRESLKVKISLKDIKKVNETRKVNKSKKKKKKKNKENKRK